MIFIHQLQKRSSRIEKILKRQGLLKEEGHMPFEFIKKIIGRKGFFDVDARFLLVIMALLILWLLWKAGKLPF